MEFEGLLETAMKMMEAEGEILYGKLKILRAFRAFSKEISVLDEEIIEKEYGGDTTLFYHDYILEGDRNTDSYDESVSDIAAKISEEYHVDVALSDLLEFSYETDFFFLSFRPVLLSQDARLADVENSIKVDFNDRTRFLLALFQKLLKETTEEKGGGE